MKRSRVLWICTVLFFAGILAACGGKSGGAKSGERVTITAVAYVSGGEPDGRRTDPVTKYIEDSLNINLDLTSVNDQDYQTKMSAMVAAGDLPDIFKFLVSDYNKQLQMLMQSNQMLCLEPYVEQYATRTIKELGGRVMLEALRGPAFSPDRKLWLWGMVKNNPDDGTMPSSGHFLQWDVYKKAGYPKLESFDTDLIDVLEKMVAAEPVSLSGAKTYAAGAWWGDGQGWGEGSIDWGLSRQEGGVIEPATGRTIAISTYESTAVPVNQLTDPKSWYWRNMQFYNRLNQRGILDPDSFTQKYDTYLAKVMDGRYMFNIAGWQASPANLEFNKRQGNQKTYISLPSIQGTAEYRFVNHYRGEHLYGVSAKTEHPEKCVELLDFLSTYEFSRIALNGPEGINWNMVNGKPVPTEEYLNTTRDDPFGVKTGANVYSHFQGYANGSIDPATGVAVDLFLYSPQAIERKMNNTIRDFLSFWGYDNLVDLYRGETEHPDGVTIVSFGEVPEDLDSYINGLNAYIGKNFTKVIAAKNDAEFAEFRDELIRGMAAYHIDEIYDHFYNEAVSQGDEVRKLTAMIEGK